MAALMMVSSAQGATLVRPIGGSGSLALPTPGVWLITLETTIPVSGDLLGYAEEKYNYFSVDGHYTGGNERDDIEYYELSDVTYFQFHFRVNNPYVYYQNSYNEFKKVGYFDHGQAMFWLTAAAPGTMTLTVERVGEAPEPAAWGLMILGFAATGAMLRRRSRDLATERWRL